MNRPVIATDIDGTIAHSNDAVEIVSALGERLVNEIFKKVFGVRAVGDSEIVSAFDISNPLAGDRVFFDTVAREMLLELSRKGDIVITTGARTSTIENRKPVFDFASYFSIEGGGVILNKNFHRDIDWWQELEAKRAVLREFVKFLESKGLVLDMDGRTSEIRIRRKDNLHLNDEDFKGTLHEALLRTPAELQKTENLGHSDIVVATKAEAFQYIVSEKLKRTQADTFAMGDDVNDIELLRMVNRAWILGNAHPELLKIAKHMPGARVTWQKYFRGTREAIQGILDEIGN